jgi:glycine/sarcosine N-methyltransferase
MFVLTWANPITQRDELRAGKIRSGTNSSNRHRIGWVVRNVRTLNKIILRKPGDWLKLSIDRAIFWWQRINCLCSLMSRQIAIVTANLCMSIRLSIRDVHSSRHVGGRTKRIDRGRDTVVAEKRFWVVVVLDRSKGASEMSIQRQTFGSDPLKVRNTEHYKMEYVHSFVEKWDTLIDWDARTKSEGDFFVRILREHNVRRVLDVATGTGFHSIRLLEAGFDVTSLDGSQQMLTKAFENARRSDLLLRAVHGDWRWLCRDLAGAFDALVCLGNSFTHLFTEPDRRRCLAEFYAMLKHDGVLILDHRNYDAILDHAHSPRRTYYYCGENVRVQPEHVDEGLARFRYEFPDESVFHLNMFPLRKDYTLRLMKEAGFQSIKSYGDFQEIRPDSQPDFFVHVVDKRYESGKDV